MIKRHAVPVLFSSMYIPARLSSNVGSFVFLEMDTDKPYIHHDEVQRIISARQAEKRG